MKVTALLPFLVASVFANNPEISCTDETLDPATEILSMQCKKGDTKVPASLNLNKCFAYQNNNIVYKLLGNFGDQCDDCTVGRYLDPVFGGWGTTHLWMNCTCDGTNDVALRILSSKLDNKDGELKCSYYFQPGEIDPGTG